MEKSEPTQPEIEYLGDKPPFEYDRYTSWYGFKIPPSDFGDFQSLIDVQVWVCNARWSQDGEGGWEMEDDGRFTERGGKLSHDAFADLVVDCSWDEIKDQIYTIWTESYEAP